MTRTPMVPHPRRILPRVSALVVSSEASHRGNWIAHLRGIGIGRIYEALTPAEAVTKARKATAQGVCIVEGSPQERGLLGVLRDLRAQGWDRLVLVSPRSDARTVQLALASRVRSLVIAAKSPLQRSGSSQRSGPDKQGFELSDREIQVVQLVANGHTNRSVAEELNLSALTVKSHLSRIGRKLGTGDRAQIVATCIRSGLIG